MESILNDSVVTQAISNIMKRSERQEDIDILIKTFVDDVGVLMQINNNNNQIMYGRRGTGKTHVLKVLYNQKIHHDNTVATYIDMRMLGSTNQFTDKTRPLSTRCYGLFKDFLSEIHDVLLEYVSQLPSDKVNFAFEELNKLSETITQVLHEQQEFQYSAEEQLNLSNTDEVSLGIGTKRSEFRISQKDENKYGRQYGASVKAVPSLNFVVPDLFKKIKSIMENAGLNHFYILIDEWTTLDADLQPYFAEFLKKTFFPNSRVTIKVASLEYRSKFFVANSDSNNITGFELGGDISADLNLDDYYVYDKSPELVTETYGKLLYYHLRSQVPEEYLETSYSIREWKGFINKLFTSKQTFSELVRAAEGVARDLIHIFTIAFFDARKSNPKIDLKSIEEAAANWYQQDKSANLTEEQYTVLTRIVDQVIAEKKARSFLLEQKYGKHHMIRSLFDSRVVHLMQKGYSYNERPGCYYYPILSEN